MPLAIFGLLEVANPPAFGDPLFQSGFKEVGHERPSLSDRWGFFFKCLGSGYFKKSSY